MKCTYEKTEQEDVDSCKNDTNVGNTKSAIIRNDKFLNETTAGARYSSSSAESNVSDVYDYSSENCFQGKTFRRRRRNRRNKKKNENKRNYCTIHNVNIRSQNDKNEDKELENDVVSMKMIRTHTNTKATESINEDISTLANCMENRQMVTALVHREEQYETKETSIKSQSSENDSKSIDYQKLDAERSGGDLDACSNTPISADGENSLRSDDKTVNNEKNIKHEKFEKIVDNRTPSTEEQIGLFDAEVFSNVLASKFNEEQNDYTNDLKKEDDSHDLDTDLKNNGKISNTNESIPSETFEEFRLTDCDSKTNATKEAKSASTKHPMKIYGRPTSKQQIPNGIENVDREEKRESSQTNNRLENTKRGDTKMNTDFARANKNDYGIQLAANEIINESRITNEKSLSRNDTSRTAEHDENVIFRIRSSETNFSNEKCNQKNGLICVILDDDEHTEITQQKDMVTLRNGMHCVKQIKERKNSAPEKQRRFVGSFKVLPTDDETSRASPLMLCDDSGFEHSPRHVNQLTTCESEFLT